MFDLTKLPAVTPIDRFRGCLVGLAVGDAIGATNEFKARSECRRNPVTDMVGGGPWAVRPGDWTDDTSMALAMAESLRKCNGFSPSDMLDEFAWWMQGKKHCGTHGRGCFDIGGTTRSAITRYLRTGETTADINSSSEANGCIMRLAPAAMWGVRMLHPANRAAFYRRTSSLTHANPVCLATTQVLGELLHALLTRTAPPRDVFTAHVRIAQRLDEVLTFPPGVTPSWLIPEADSRILPTGHCIDTLEAALWAVNGATDFRSAIVRAVNLGGDADTVGAVAGQLAGARFGMSGVPAEWVAKLDKRDEIIGLADAMMPVYSLDYATPTQAVEDPALVVVELGEAGA